jgi:hypothetical protein
VDPALARDGKLVAVRALHDTHVGCQQREVQEVPAVVRQVRDRRFGKPVRGRHLGRLHHALLRLDHNRRELYSRERQPQLHRFAHAYRDAPPRGLAEPDRLRDDVVAAEREQRGDEHALLVSRERAREVGQGISHGHRRTLHGVPIRVRDHAADDARGGLRLGAER